MKSNKFKQSIKFVYIQWRLIYLDINLFLWSASTPSAKIRSYPPDHSIWIQSNKSVRYLEEKWGQTCPTNKFILPLNKFGQNSEKFGWKMRSELPPRATNLVKFLRNHHQEQVYLEGGACSKKDNIGWLVGWLVAEPPPGTGTFGRGACLKTILLVGWLVGW